MTAPDEVVEDLRGGVTGDTPTCTHGITLADRVTGRERCAECGAIVTEDTNHA